jgi:hypothetical protein
VLAATGAATVIRRVMSMVSTLAARAAVAAAVGVMVGRVRAVSAVCWGALLPLPEGVYGGRAVTGPVALPLPAPVSLPLRQDDHCP